MPNRNLSSLFSPFLSSGKLEDADDKQKDSEKNSRSANDQKDDDSDDSDGFWH